MTTINTKTTNLIDAKTLDQMIQQKNVTLIDVREAGEHANERIAESSLMSLSQFDPQQLPLKANKTLVLYCQSGNRSNQALQKTKAHGLEGILHLQGGIIAWKQAGFPTIKSKNAPISLFRQVQIVAGSLVFLGTVLGVLVSPNFLILSGFVGAGLVFAGVTNTCAMGLLLAKLPYNHQSGNKL